MASEIDMDLLYDAAINVDWMTLMGDNSPESSTERSLQAAETTAVNPLLDILQQKLQKIRQAQEDDRRKMEILRDHIQQLNYDAFQLELCSIHHSKPQGYAFAFIIILIPASTFLF